MKMMCCLILFIFQKGVQPDSRDTDMKIRRELIGDKQHGATPFGVLTAGDEVIDYLKSKKDQEGKT